VVQRFSHAGLRFQGALGKGECEVTAFIWNTLSGRFEVPRTTTVVVT
jgi:hypothetical protein